MGHKVQEELCVFYGSITEKKHEKYKNYKPTRIASNGF